MLPKTAVIFAILFWILFLFLNTLLFFPAYFVHSNFVMEQLAQGQSLSWWQPLLTGDYALLFRFCGDFILVLLPVLLLKKNTWLKNFYTPLVALVYLLLLYYNIYYEGYKTLYGVHPIFEKDWAIVKQIMPTFLREVSVKGSTYLLGALSFLAVSILLFLLVQWLQNKLIKLKNKPIFWIIGIVSLFFVIFAYPKPTTALIESTEDSHLNQEISPQQDTLFVSLDTMPIKPLKWIYPDIKISATLNRKEHLAHLKKRWLYDFYKKKKLIKKPNIYLLFIESYGGVATLSDYCEAPYDTLTTRLTHQLNSAGWFTASNYSKSTVIGGRSWLAMTTALIGARIEDQIQYSELINNQQGYPHMVDFFNAQDYETYKVSTMRIGRIDTLNLITIPNQFWGYDYRYFYPDIPYTGFAYDYYGGIPDQFTLGYAEEEILSKSDKPYFFTLITMNSHGPWQSKMPPIVEDWRTLKDLKKPFGDTELKADMHISSYWIAMEYQLKMMTDFIIKKGDDNSIFIILGDHNPGGLEYKLYKKFNKWATPIHIIGKDSTFIQSFHQHGFTEGMKVDTSQYTIMRHMGLYSLLTRQLLEKYGEEKVVLPDYLPWGL